MKYTHIVWDFNGTIFDDLLPSIESTNEMLEKRGIPAFDNVEAYRRVFGFPVKNYYERIGFDFSVTPYEELAVEWVALYLEKTKNSGLMPGVAQALEKFQKMVQKSETSIQGDIEYNKAIVAETISALQLNEVIVRDIEAIIADNEAVDWIKRDSVKSKLRIYLS